MSKIIASAAIRGAHKIFNMAEKKYQETIEKYGPEQEVGFPNTAYYLPIIYAMTGIKVANIEDMKQVLDICRRLIPPPVRENVPLPYLAPALDAGMATFFAEEMVEAIRYLEDPDCYAFNSEDPTDKTIWLGAANDVIFRKRGVEFVDGTAPGFAAIVGAAPDSATAAKIALELQEKNLYVFMCGENGGKAFCRTAQGSRCTGWLAHQACFSRTGYLSGRFCHRFCLPCCHGLWRYKTGRFPEEISFTIKTEPMPLSLPSVMLPTNGMPMLPGPSTGVSRPLPIRRFRRSCRPVSVPMNMLSQIYPMTRLCKRP